MSVLVTGLQYKSLVTRCGTILRRDFWMTRAHSISHKAWSASGDRRGGITVPDFSVARSDVASVYFQPGENASTRGETVVKLEVAVMTIGRYSQSHLSTNNCHSIWSWEASEILLSFKIEYCRMPASRIVRIISAKKAIINMPPDPSQITYYVHMYSGCVCISHPAAQWKWIKSPGPRYIAACRATSHPMILLPSNNLQTLKGQYITLYPVFSFN